jgi:hypothetical protein
MTIRLNHESKIALKNQHEDNERHSDDHTELKYHVLKKHLESKDANNSENNNETNAENASPTSTPTPAATQTAFNQISLKENLANASDAKNNYGQQPNTAATPAPANPLHATPATNSASPSTPKNLNHENNKVEEDEDNHEAESSTTDASPAPSTPTATATPATPAPATSTPATSTPASFTQTKLKNKLFKKSKQHLRDEEEKSLPEEHKKPHAYEESTMHREEKHPEEERAMPRQKNNHVKREQRLVDNQKYVNNYNTTDYKEKLSNAFTKENDEKNSVVNSTRTFLKNANDDRKSIEEKVISQLNTDLQKRRSELNETFQEMKNEINVLSQNSTHKHIYNDLSSKLDNLAKIFKEEEDIELETLARRMQLSDQIYNVKVDDLIKLKNFTKLARKQQKKTDDTFLKKEYNAHEAVRQLHQAYFNKTIDAARDDYNREKEEANKLSNATSNVEQKAKDHLKDFDQKAKDNIKDRLNGELTLKKDIYDNLKNTQKILTTRLNTPTKDNSTVPTSSAASPPVPASAPVPAPAPASAPAPTEDA